MEDDDVAVNVCADQFSKHDFFSINCFCTTSATLPVAVPELTDEDLMNNWKRWYTYKLLASHYLNACFCIDDAMLADKTRAYDEISISTENSYYLEISAAIRQFYKKQRVSRNETKSFSRDTGIDCVRFFTDLYDN